MAVYRCGGCPVEVCNSGKPCQTRQVSYEGAVLAVYEANGYDDSDFYAVVWDAQAGCVRDVEYATTRGWTYHNGAAVDATAQVREAAMDWYRVRWIDATITRAHADAVKPAKGRVVRSLTTRGKNVGLVGEVRWIGEDKYRSTRWITYYRVGVKVEGEDKLRYLDWDRVEVVEPTPVDEDAIRDRARRLAEPDWAGVVRALVYQAVAAA